MSYKPGYSFTQPINPSFLSSTQSFSTSQSSVSKSPNLNPQHSKSTNQMPSDNNYLQHAISQSHVSSSHKPALRIAITNGLWYYHFNYPGIFISVLQIVSILILLTPKATCHLIPAVFFFNTLDASPYHFSYIKLYDQLNNLAIHVDIARPRFLIPIRAGRSLKLLTPNSLRIQNF